MAKQIARDVAELAGENTLIFRQLCEFTHTYPKVVRHIKRKSHQIRVRCFVYHSFPNVLIRRSLIPIPFYR